MIYVVIVVLVFGYSIFWGFMTRWVAVKKGHSGTRGFLDGLKYGFIGFIFALCSKKAKPADSDVRVSSSMEPILNTEAVWRCAKCRRWNSGIICDCGMFKGDSSLLEKKNKEAENSNADEKTDGQGTLNSEQTNESPIDNESESAGLWNCVKCGRWNAGIRCECGMYKGDNSRMAAQSMK